MTDDNQDTRKAVALGTITAMVEIPVDATAHEAKERAKEALREDGGLQDFIGVSDRETLTELNTEGDGPAFNRR